MEQSFIRCVRLPFVLFLILLLVPSCRENPPLSPDGTANRPPVLSWTPGTRFVYDTYAISTNGLLIPSSHCTSIRTVARAGLTAFGRDNVVMMTDSIAIPGAPARLDTVYCNQTENGDFWQYALLATVNQRYYDTSAAPQWDCISALSLMGTGGWTVGLADSSQEVFGEITDTESYFAATVNGQSTAFRVSRMDLYGLTFEYIFYLSSTPASFARIVELNSDTVNGLYRNLTSVSTR
jgi:hypothetical protein